MMDSRNDEMIGSNPPISAKFDVISSGCITSLAMVS